MQTMGPARAVAGQEVGSELWPRGACGVPRAHRAACAAPAASRAGCGAVRELACASGFVFLTVAGWSVGVSVPLGYGVSGCSRPCGTWSWQQGEAAPCCAGGWWCWGKRFSMARGVWAAWERSVAQMCCGGTDVEPPGPVEGAAQGALPLPAWSWGPCRCGALQHPEGLRG